MVSFFLEIIEVRQENAYLFCLRAEEFLQGLVFKLLQSYKKKRLSGYFTATKIIYEVLAVFFPWTQQRNDQYEYQSGSHLLIISSIMAYLNLHGQTICLFGTKSEGFNFC